MGRVFRFSSDAPPQPSSFGRDAVCRGRRAGAVHQPGQFLGQSRTGSALRSIVAQPPAARRPRQPAECQRAGGSQGDRRRTRHHGPRQRPRSLAPESAPSRRGCRHELVAAPARRPARHRIRLVPGLRIGWNGDRRGRRAPGRPHDEPPRLCAAAPRQDDEPRRAMARLWRSNQTRAARRAVARGPAGPDRADRPYHPKLGSLRFQPPVPHGPAARSPAAGRPEPVHGARRFGRGVDQRAGQCRRKPAVRRRKRQRHRRCLRAPESRSVAGRPRSGRRSCPTGAPVAAGSAAPPADPVAGTASAAGRNPRRTSPQGLRPSRCATPILQCNQRNRPSRESAWPAEVESTMKPAFSFRSTERSPHRRSRPGRSFLALPALLAVAAFAAVWVPGHWEEQTVNPPIWLYEWIDGYWTDPIEVPEHTETQWIEGHWEEYWVDGYQKESWAEGHWEEQWIDGHWEEQWVDGYQKESWIEGHWEDEWVEGHWEDQWVDGYWDEDGNWHDGYWETNWVDGYWNSHWVDGYWDTTWVDGHNETVWVDGYLDQNWIEGHWEYEWVEEHWNSRWVDGYWETVTIQAYTLPPLWVDGYWGWNLYSVIQVWVDGQWVGEWTWTAFDEVGDWYPVSAWSPDPSTVPAREPFPQTCAAARDHRTGERNEAGEERNIATTVETGGTLSRPAFGTGTEPVVAGGSASGTVGADFSYQISATNSPTSYGAVGLPGGLTLNGTSGLIHGVPTQPGTSSVTMSASNAAGTGSATLTITITVGGGDAPSVANGSASGVVGVVFSYQIVATNDPTNYVATGLPGGLSVNATSGQISGTPTQAGTFSVSLTAANAAGTSATATLVLTIDSDGGGGPSTYTLTVVNGTGGASGLLPGAIRTITATVPAGALFTGWEISGPGTIPPSRLGASRLLTMGAGNVTATATYQFPGPQPLWFDVNDDGIRDEVVTRGVQGFNYAITDIWTTYEYESDNWDIFFDWRDLNWPGGFLVDTFPNLWLSYRPPAVTNLTTWISAEAVFDAEVGEQYRVMGWNRSGYWGDYATLVLQAGDNLHPTVYLPSLRPEDYLAFQFVRARIGLPIHTLRVNGAPAISIGGVLPITLPATGGTTLSLSVSNILGRVLQNGPQIVWEVWDA
ncbi:MAG: hypothetical protein FJ189_03325, partial [Gammaproteobacteria bacterium]|nr:hypothetical protein [Gammaproteobacteria bacterium]